MYWIIVFSVTILGAIVQILVSSSTGFTPAHIAEVSLIWLLAGFYGVATFLAGLQHLFNSDKIANYIGWLTGSGFQLELGWAEVGLGLASFLAIWFRGTYLISSSIAGSALFLGAAFVHARDMAKKGNLNPGNAGPVFYIDILAPILVIVMLILYSPWK
jgi:Family of unknown function (DUF6790)